MARRAFPKEAAERVTLSVRTTTRVRDALDASAVEEGRSLSQEMERRLAESLMVDSLVNHTAKLARDREMPIVDMLGGPETFGLLQDIAWLISAIEDDGEGRWHESAEMRAKVFKVLEAALADLLRLPRSKDIGPVSLSAIFSLSKYLPEKPKSPAPEMPKGARFMTDDELKQFFYLQDDNADAPEKAARRRRSIRIPLKPKAE